jgi:hypothetical protein
MVYNREGYAPWSLTRKAGVQSATVDGTIEVPQYIQPVLDTGFVDEKGDWKGTKSSDEQFRAFTKDEAIPNTGEILTPSENADGSWPLDTTGFNHVMIAVKPSRAGNYAMSAVMGPDTVSFANLNPVAAASILRGADFDRGGTADLQPLFEDGAQSLIADVWNIFPIFSVLANQKILQFKIVNNTGGEAATIECAFMRLI